MTDESIFKVNFTFDDIDDLTETARDWDATFRQLEAGKLRSEFSQIGLPGVQLIRCKINRQMHQTGMPPRDGRTFVIPNLQNFNYLWRGKQVNSKQALCFPRNQEYESSSDNSFDVLTVTLSDDLLERLHEGLEMDGKQASTYAHEVTVMDPRMFFILQLQLNRIHNLTADEFVLNQSSIIEDVDSLAGLLIKGWSASPDDLRCQLPRNHTRLIAAATRYIELNSKGPILMWELCEHLGCSERSVQYAFKRHFGLSPKQYITACRLKAVRRALIQNSSESITKIAGDWGFWHMGQFAADYRRLFGELPKVTLANANVRAAADVSGAL